MTVLDDISVFRPSKIGALRDLLFALLQEHKRDGMIPTNARFLYYELVQRGELSKQHTGARRPDQDLHDALIDIREDGRVPWEWIIDETRSVEDYTGYPRIRDGVLAQLPYIKLDPWRRRVPLLLTESRSLAGVLRSVVSEHRARIASTNGQCGGFLRTEIAPLLRPGDAVGYLGDLDLSGGHIENNTRRVLEREIGGELHWERVALTTEQVERYDLLKIIKRDRRYKDGHPHEAVETEAIGQRVLIEILRAWLAARMPEPLERVQEREQRQRARLLANLIETAKKAFSGVNKMTLPTQLSPRVAALLKEMRTARARLIFAVDATGSREATWDLATQLQSEMFETAAAIGGLIIQLVFYRGTNQCSHTKFLDDAQELATQMRCIRCEAGATQIGRVLQHIRAEHAREKVNAAIFVGDAVEEAPGELYDAATGLGVPCFLFQEGDGLVVRLDRLGQIVNDHPPQKVEQVFRELARLTNGAYGKFDGGAAKQLGELLRAVAAFAGGGLTALADLRTESARKLLGQLKQQ